MSKNRLIILDFRQLLNQYSSYSGLYTIYKRFPLQEVISTLLTISPFVDYSDILRIETEQRFHDIIDYIDIESIDMFYENIAIEMDSYIRVQVTDDFDYSEYRFDKWIDQTSALIRLD